MAVSKSELKLEFLENLSFNVPNHIRLCKVTPKNKYLGTINHYNDIVEIGIYGIENGDYKTLEEVAVGIREEKGVSQKDVLNETISKEELSDKLLKLNKELLECNELLNKLY